MSHRHRSNYLGGNGVIRPRHFNTKYSKEQKQGAQVFGSGKLTSKAIYLLIGVGICLLYITVSNRYVSTTKAPKISSASDFQAQRLGRTQNLAVEAEEDITNDVDIGEEEDDAESDEDADESNAEDLSDADDNNEDDEALEETKLSKDELKSESNNFNRQISQQNRLRLTLNSYFHNLGKRPATIDSSGSFKYVLAKATDSEQQSAFLIQGCPTSLGRKCKHPDAAEILRNSLKPYDIAMEVLGGGRITWHGLRKSKRKLGVISVFGYSKSFGECAECNKIACDVLFRQYPDYVVRYSNQGYNEKDEYKIRDFVKCSA